MIRLNMVVEGQTEETFVHQVLEGHLAQRNVFVFVRCVETSRDKRRHKIYRGGLLDYARAKGDLFRWMKEDRHEDARFTTMFDLYALPDDFPGRQRSRGLATPRQRVEALEEAFEQDINDRRFLPYLQLHEFEALLLADPAQFEWEFIEHAEAIGRLTALAAGYESPEEIDEGDESAPSKRVIREIPEYEFRKASAGPLIASKIGLPRLREKCPHFSRWLEMLEALS
jgi:hypothetical protein